MKNVINWFTGERRLPDKAWRRFLLNAATVGFFTMTLLAVCGCDSTPSISNADRKDPKKFAEFVVAEFAKGNYKPYEQYPAVELGEKIERHNAWVKSERAKGDTDVMTYAELKERWQQKEEKILGKVVSYGVYSMTPDKRYTRSGREAMGVRYWMIREHFKLTDPERKWYCANDSEEECKKKRCMGQFLVVKEHDGLWHIDENF